MSTYGAGSAGLARLVGRDGSANSSAVQDPSPTSAGGSATTGFKVYGSLFKVDARYQFINPLGKGSYGIVCAAKDRDTGQCMAIKKVCPMAKRSVDAKHTLREILLLQFLGKHPNIVSIHNLSTNLKDDELYIVMDLMDTDMHRVIQSSQPLSESHVKYFLHQLLRGVKYLHDNGVLHRDLKPGNLLLTKTCQLKIADFGLARKVPKGNPMYREQHTPSGGGGGSERPRSAPAMSASRQAERAPMTEHVVTRWYRAPELMLQPDGFYDSSVDMWSIGCIFAEILGRKALFPGKNFLHQLSLIFDVIGTPPPEATIKIKSSQAQRFIKSLGKKPRVPFRSLFPTASDDAIDLLDKLLEFDPEKRISAREALAHPYLQAIEKKHKAVDPHPSMRVDFSFDSKKLTKMDLRALIIKEVEVFRKSLAHTAALDASVTDDDTRERERERERERPESTDNGTHDKRGSTATSRLTPSSTANMSTTPLASASTALNSNNTPGHGSRVLCGSAAMSMMHSNMRQQSQDAASNGQPSTFVPPTTSTSASANTTTPTSTILGASRQRIRMASKPPVPRQQQLTMTTATSNQHDQIRVASGRPSMLLTSQGSNTAIPPLDNTAIAGRSQGSSDVGMGPHLTTEQGQATASSISKASTTRREAETGRRNGGDGGQCHDQEVSLGVVTPTPLRKVPSKLLRQPEDGSTTGAKSTHQLRPESSSSSSSSSASSPSSSDDDAEAKRIRQSLAETATRTADAGKAAVAPRRVASAGPVRLRPTTGANVVMTSSQQQQQQQATTTVHNAFVGSTTSLIRAQRSSNGQSLTESGNMVYANMTTTATHKPPAQLAHQQLPTNQQPEGTTTTSTLKTQRSSSNLMAQEPSVKKPLGQKRLTVPKSPKFSVMSWQKKREGSSTSKASQLNATATMLTSTFRR